jgi:hypothetical protein
MAAMCGVGVWIGPGWRAKDFFFSENPSEFQTKFAKKLRLGTPLRPGRA